MKPASPVKKVVTRLARGASRALDLCIGSLLLVIVAIVLAQVVGRYVLGNSLIWSEELTRLLHVWLIMLAAIKASHMKIELFVNKFPTGLKVSVRFFSAALSIALLVLMIKGGINMIALTSYDMYTGLKLSVKYVYVALVFAAVLWIPVLAFQAILPPQQETE